MDEAAAALDSMLAGALLPPALPADFQAQVMAAVARDPRDPAALRLQIRDDHRRSVARLRRRSGLEAVEALVFAACIFFPLKMAVHTWSLRLGSSGLSPPEITALAGAAAVAAATWLSTGSRARRAQGGCLETHRPLSADRPSLSGRTGRPEPSG